jgi:hypothetical protein
MQLATTAAGLFGDITFSTTKIGTIMTSSTNVCASLFSSARSSSQFFARGEKKVTFRYSRGLIDAAYY